MGEAERDLPVLGDAIFRGVAAADGFSALRIALALLIAAVATVFFSPSAFAVMLGAFVIGIATDIIGGILPRGHVTAHGRVLDSLADKALVYSVLIPIALRGFPPVLLFVLLGARDAVAVALQVFAAARGRPLPVGQLGRWKAAVLYVACALLLTLAWLQSGSGPVRIDPGDLGTILPFLLVSQLAIVVGILLAFVSLFHDIAAFRSSRA